MDKEQNKINQARQLHQSGRVREAIDRYVEILPRQNGNALLLYLLGSAYLQTGRNERAVDLLRQSLAINPRNPFAHYNSGLVFQNLKRPDEALASYDRAIALKPDYAEAYNNRGNALRDLERQDEALVSFERAVALKPNHANAYNNRGNALRDLDRPEEALASYDQAIALKPDYAEAHGNRGSICHDLNCPDEALASFDRAIALRPDYAEAHWNKSLLLILRGRYREGWELFEWRLKKDDVEHQYYNFPQPAWRGQEDIRGRKLLIHAEQGLGDVVQFCRYLPRIEEQGAEIIFEAPKPLVPLVSTLNCPMTMVAKGDQLPAFDAYCPIMSLPHAFRTTVETIPADIPYLSSAPNKVRRWRERLGNADGLRIGLVWSGSERHKNDRNRSIPLAEFLSLTGTNLEWHSLQKEYRPRDLEVLGQHPEIRQHQDDLEDFSDTAALIQCLDLIISVDTSVAHVAGAMGKPVWILLACSPDYRWMLEREDSPWYPTARLFRQPKIGDWQSVLARVREDLIALMQ